MDSNTLFSSGSTSELVPEGDAARQAVNSLRGYAYQVLASALAWVDLGDADRLYLEVAEDYAVMAQNLSAVQVKDTAASATVTLNSQNVRDAIGSFVDLVARNRGVSVELRYLTTSEIGIEKEVRDRPGGIAGLEYWRKAAAGSDVAPLRPILESQEFLPAVRAFVHARNDTELRNDLLQKVHWDCGAPDFLTLHADLEERLVVIGRDRFRLAASEARRLADVLAHRVLLKCVLKEPEQRVLTRAGLYEILSAAAEVAVPRAAFFAILSQLTDGMAGSLAPGARVGSTLEAHEPGWLITSDSLPPPHRFIARQALERAVASSMDQFGAAILIGATGLGKSHVARITAEERGEAFALVDLRDVDAAEARRRLDIVFGRIGGMQVPLLVLEDLNQLDDPGVSRAMGRVLEALRRRDRIALVTCYRKPSAKAAAAAGIDLRGTVECTYFSEQETNQLVALYGGDAARWGLLAFVAGASGHPQLTHAFVLGMSDRAWQQSEVPGILSRGVVTGDIDAERESARRALVSSLPESARNLLYRLSLARRFKRSTALVVGRVQPSISQVGESLDLLVGPWIEAIGPEYYRVSPLAKGIGRGLLPADEQIRIDESIAIHMLTGERIDASDADEILTHALLGRSTFCLAKLASGVLTAPSERVPLLASNLVIFQLFATNAPIFPDAPAVGMLLRLAQFKLTAAAEDKRRAKEVASALFQELSSIEQGELRQISEAMALGSVLATMGVADYLDNWVTLLCRYKRLAESNALLSQLHKRFEERWKGTHPGVFASLFAMGASQVTSVARLEHVVDQLAQLQAKERAELLKLDTAVPDYEVLINVPWATEQRRGDFDAGDAATRYSRMAEKSKDWGIAPFTIQCWIARAVMLDEYLNDGDGALKVLDEAIAIFGGKAPLLRAKAKIYWRRSDHPSALAILRNIADELGGGSSVVRAFALREAAISAARCNDWKLAGDWFEEASRAAASSQTANMLVMALGLSADAAVAALMDGDTRAALRGLANALAELPGFDPDGSLSTAYLHRAIRHTVLWALSKLAHTDVRISGEAIDISPGCCSNPQPLSSIKELPLASLDSAWYLLAEAEIASGFNEGIVDGLHPRLAGGTIPIMEVGLRRRRMQKAIEGSDPNLFAQSLGSYLDGLGYLVTKRSELRANFEGVSGISCVGP